MAPSFRCTFLYRSVCRYFRCKTGIPDPGPDRQYRDLRYDRQASIDIFRDAIDKMVDHSCDAKTEESMKREILKVPGVRRVDLLKTRLFGSKMYVDIEIAADGSISLFDAHDIAENVHHTIENKFKDVKHCMVHVNPING